MFKKILVLTVCLMMALGVASCAKEKDVLKVGMECDYAPFNWTQATASETSVPLEDGGYADGYDVQIAKMMADALGRKLEVVKTDWAGLPQALESGKIDLIIAGMSPTADRKLTIDFTDAYYTSELVIVVNRNSVYTHVTELSGFSGAVVTGQINTVHYDVIDQIPGVVKENAMETFPAMIVALTSGKIDGYVSELPGAVSAVAANSDLSFVQFAVGQGFVAAEDDVAVAIGVKKGNEDLVSQLNEALSGISEQTRQQMMTDAVANQPLSQL
ncbi:MAG: transporter substrate-binding domain-containing protein [Eubacteriaceae bacterium]|nr:transporter substrate-binding domain-containing protein [Eubacteriaceae bacterium]